MIDGIVNVLRFFFAASLHPLRPSRLKAVFALFNLLQTLFRSGSDGLQFIINEFHRRFFFDSRAKGISARWLSDSPPQMRNHWIDDLPAWIFSCAACETIPTMTAFLVMSSRKWRTKKTIWNASCSAPNNFFPPLSARKFFARILAPSTICTTRPCRCKPGELNPRFDLNSLATPFRERRQTLWER